MLNLKDFSIGKKLAFLTGVLLVVLLLSGLLSYRAISNLSEQQENLGHVQIVAVRNITLADMMHDGLRSLLYMALVAAETNNDGEKQSITKEFKEFSTSFKTYLDNVDVLPLRAETKAAIAKVRPDLNAYLSKAESLTHLALNGKRSDAVAGLAEFQSAYEKLEESMGQLGDLVEKDAQNSVEQSLAESSVAKRNAVLLLIVSLLTGMIASFYLARIITRPLQQMALVASKIAEGDVQQNITYQAKDEIGTLANSFRDLIVYIKDAAQAAAAVSQGDLTARIVPRSSNDLLLHNVSQVISTMRSLIEETTALSQAAQAGQLGKRGQTARFQGAYRDLVEGINATLDAVVKPIEGTSQIIIAGNLDIGQSVDAFSIELCPPEPT